MGVERIEINIPDFTLRLMDGDDVVRQARVIISKPDTPTQSFSNAIEMRPRRSDMAHAEYDHPPGIRAAPSEGVRLPRAHHSYQVAEISNHMFVEPEPPRRRQRARPHPVDVCRRVLRLSARHAAARPVRTARRAYSHGCVQLDQPMRLADLVMGVGWSARLQAMIGSTERTVMLPHPSDHLEYFTEFVDAAGALQEREDVYGSPPASQAQSPDRVQD